MHRIPSWFAHRHRTTPGHRDNSNSPYKSTWVHGRMRIEGRLDPFGDGPVGPGLAPDGERFLPRSGAASQDQVAPFLGGHLFEFRNRRGHLLERPFALCVGVDDPVAGVCLRRPLVRVKALDERRD